MAVEETMRRVEQRRTPLPIGGGLSKLLLQWIDEKVPPDDPIRIASMEKRKLIQTLGNGRFGEVRKYMNEETMVPEAVKAVKMEVFDHWGQDEFRLRKRLDNFLKELRHLCTISTASTRIANFLGFYADSEQILMITEFLTTGSVKDRLVKEAIPEQLAVKYLKEAAKGLNYLHSLDPSIVHSDIKAANLLITISDSIKLTNFGLVRDLAIDGFGVNVASDVAFDFRGTLLYAAPEVLTNPLGPGNRKAYDKPADLWALGCTFVEMLARFPPHYEYFGLVKEVFTEVIERAAGPPENWLPYSADVLIPTCSRRVNRLVDAMLEREVDLRPTAKGLLQLIDEEQKPSTSQVQVDLTQTAVKESPPELTYVPMETLDGVLRRPRNETKQKRTRTTAFGRFCSALQYYASRALYFMSLLSKSVLYVLVFLFIGLSTLAIFLFLSYVIVLFCRYLIQLRCNCDLAQPQYLIISGILLILLFALLFSCCMVALGEYKYRMANKSLRESRFFVPRPSKDVRLCGMKLLSGKPPDLPEMADDDFYYA